MKIHKAVRPKKDYLNPTLCCTKFKDDDITYYNQNYAHQFSRIEWNKVTCKKCLALKGKRRFLGRII